MLFRSVSGWLQDKVDRLEGELARANREIDRLHSRPAPASDRENYIIGEMDFVNRQLECRPFHYSTLCFDLPVSRELLFFMLLFYAGFVADHVGEKERVAERLQQEAVENPTTGSQHFWQGEYNPRVLATLKDRVW